MKYLPLIRLLVSRELTLRYKRSVIGIGWTLLNPVLTSFVLWVVFSYVFAGRLPNGQQYAPYLMAGIVLNSFFNQGLMLSANSIQANSGVLTKIYVAPQVFPISVALAGLVNFFIGLIPLAAVVYISGQTLSLTFPLVIIVGFFLALLVAGIGLSLSLVFIRYDDTKNIVGILLLILTYVTPIFYPISALSQRMQKIINLNPLTSYLDCFRWAFSNNATATIYDWLYMSSTGILAILIGTYIFKKYWPRTVAML
ncbi:MAG: ABC transporter permease [Candidatus Planktophila sp.]|jgi:ABC-type polysaccharide/polyol phosphate export permease